MYIFVCRDKVKLMFGFTGLTSVASFCYFLHDRTTLLTSYQAKCLYSLYILDQTENETIENFDLL